MRKKIVYGNDAKNGILNGIEKLYNAVGITLGPQGKNVAIKSGYSPPVIINDGVSIAKEVELEDEVENFGAQIIKEVAKKTNENAGDGTTTATVLAYNMVKEGMKNILSGANPMEIRKGMNIACAECVKNIKEISKSISSNEQIREIASISAGDKEIGNLITSAIEKIGKDGVITLGESKTSQTRLNLVEGLQIDSGYISSYMISDELEEEEIENPYILVTDFKIRNISELLPLLENIAQTNRSLIMLVDDIEGDALGTLLINKMRGTFDSIAVKAPSFGQRRKELLEDIAISVGTRLISEDTMDSLKNIELEDLGLASKVKVGKNNTIILNGNGNKEIITQRIEKIKEKINAETDEEEVLYLRKRLSILLGAVAVIEVGAATQTELNEQKLRIEDALSATRAAIEEGIVPGGGRAYLTVLSMMEDKFNNYSSDIKIGIDIVRKSLEKPLWQIAKNSGENGDIIVEKIKSMSDEIGYDAINGSFINMKENGIIDPTKVCRSALENAVSISSMLLTTDALICDVIQEES